MKKITLLLALIAINFACFGQVSSYTFASSSGTYTPLSGGTALIPPNSGISGAGWFCQNFNLTIPFVFYYNGIGFSDLYVNSNGYLTFGKPALANRSFPHTTSDGQSGTICALANSTAYGYSSSASGRIWLGSALDASNANPIMYSTIGSAPNRIFVVQWTNCQRGVAYFGSSGVAVENITFQIKLKETSNVVEIVYDNSTTNQNSTATNYYPTVGLCGASTADFNLLSGSSWSAVSNSTISSSVSIVFNSSSSITSGTTFEFTPPSGLMPSACSGTPSAPYAIATNGITCGTVGLGLVNLSLSTGLTFQWQSSETGIEGSWSSISGANDPSYIASPTASTHYRCLVACGAGTPVASGAVVVGFESSCPTMPSYTYNQFASYPLAQIGRFSIAGASCSSTLDDLTNSASAFNYTAFNGTSGTQYSYQDMTNEPTYVKLEASTSSSTTYTATIGNYGSTAVHGVWIDLNDNGSFTDGGEYVGSVSGAGATITFTLTIPSNSFGVHRMRVRGASTSYTTSTISPTGSLSSYGQCNDYKVEIVPPAPAASSNSPVCVNGTLTLSSSAISGAIYTWTGPLSYYTTTSSTSQNYAVAGTGAAGTYNLYTTVRGANACANGTTSVTVNLQPSLTNATNNSPVCATNTLTLSANGASNVTGYSWSGPVSVTSATSASASVPGATTAAAGVYTVAVNNGTGSGCTVNYTTTATVNPLPAAISGVAQACPGQTTILSSSGTGTWSSGNTSIATVGATTGIVTGIATGTVDITYTLSATGCFNVAVVTINPVPSSIGSNAPVCPGSTVTLTSASSGGTWTLGNTSLATIGTSSGTVTGISGGNPVISYTLPTGCYTTTVATVISTPPITGSLGLCTGLTSTLSNSISGGIWTSSNPSVATVGSASGIVTGVSAGLTVITYTFPSSCTITATVGVVSSINVYAVTGGGSGCGSGTSAHIFLSGSDAGVSYQLYVNTIPTGVPVLGTGAPLDFGSQTIAGSYSVVANPGTACATNMSSSAVITVLAAPSAYSVTGGGAYCPGGAGVHVGLSGSNSGITYQLYNGGSAVGSPWSGTSTILDFGSLTAVGTYTVVAANPITGCTTPMTGSATVTINPSPAVQAMTVTSGGNYCTGGTGITVGLTNSETGVNYQLFRGSTPVGGVVAGTGGVIDFGLHTIAGSYTAVATNTSTGCTATMSGAPAITVNTPPAIYAVTGGGTYCDGGTGVAIGLGGSQTGVSYQLYYDGVPSGAPVTGTGSPIGFGLRTYDIVYNVVATNTTTGCSSDMMGSATVAINPLPVVFDVTGGGDYCAGGEGLHVGLSGSVVGTDYFLYRGTTLVSGASGTSAPLDFGLFTTPGVYTVSAINPGTGCSSVMNGSVTINVNPSPVVFSVTGGGSYCAGGSGFNIGLSSSTIGVDYMLIGIGPVLFVSGTGSSLDFGTFTSPGAYTVVATNTTTGCVKAMAGSAIINIDPLPTAFAVTGGGNYCSGGTGLHVGLGSSVAGVSYQVILDGTPIGPAMAGTGSAIDFGLKTASGVYTVSATNTVTGCVNTMSGSVTIVINPLPVLFDVTGGGNYCIGGTGMNIGLSNSESGLSYQLMRGSTNVGSPLTGSTGAPLNFGPQTASGVYTVVATNLATGCTSLMNGSAVIGIDPLPTLYTVTGGGSYCIGGTGVSVGLNSSSAGISYQLYHGSSPIGAPVTGMGFAFDFGLQTPAGVYTVVAMNTATGCSSNMNGSATIVVNPLPAVFAVNGGGSYCVGGAGVHVGLISSSPAASYQLFLGSSPIGAAIPGTGTTLDFGLQTIAGMYTVVATNTVTSCTNNMSGSVTVDVNTLPTLFSLTGGGNYCPGGAGVPVGLSNSSPLVSYQLFNGSTMAGIALTGTGAALDFGYQVAPGSYTVTATNTVTGCIQNMPGSVNVAVSSMPNVFNVTGGGSYCPSAFGVHVGLSGSNTWMDYQLYKDAVAVGLPVTGTGSALDFGLQTAPGSYTTEAVGIGTTTCTGSMNGSVMVGIHPLPAVFNVTGGGNYCSGGTGVTIGLDGSALGISYQLFNGGSGVGAPLAGTGLALDFGLHTASGAYTVIGTSVAAGCTQNMTGSVGITIDPLPNVYAITGGGNYCIGGMGVTIELSNSDAGISYQLYSGITPIGTPAAGTGLPLDFGLHSATGSYTIEATNGASGCTSNMSGSAVIATNPLPVAFTVNGGGSYCAGGAGVHVSLDGSATGTTYQLLNGSAPSGTPVAGTGVALDFGLITAPGVYTVEATNTATGCINTMTDATTVTANPLPVIYPVSGSSAGYCTGGAGVTISVAGSESGVNYLLYRGGSPAGLPVGGTGAMLSMGTQTVAGAYTVVATNSITSCVSSMSGGASVAINPLPSIFTVTGGGSYCNSGSGVHIGLSGSVAGTSYQLFRAGLPMGSPMTGAGTALDFGFLLTAGNYTVIATNITTGCVSTMNGSATVVTNPLPAVYTVTGGGIYCAGGAGVAVGLSGSVPGISYQLLVDGSATGAPLTGTGGALNFGMRTIGGTYTVVATNNTTGCSKIMTGTAVVGINPSPVSYAVTGGGNYCVGGSGVHVGIGGSNTGISYRLYRGTTLVGTAVAGTGSAMDFGLQTIAGTYTIVATNTTTGCNRTMPGSASVVVNSLPVAYTVTGGGNYCAGGSGVHVGLSNSATGIDYTLYNISGSVATLTGSGLPLDFGLLPAGTYTAIGENTSTGCAQNMTGSAVVVEDPSVTPAVSLFTGVGDSVCAGRLITFIATTTNGGSAPAYEWTINGISVPAIGDNYSYLPVNGDVVRVKLTSNATCAAPAIVYNTMTMSVSTPEMPSVLVSSNKGSEVCQGTTVTFSAAASYGGTLPAYTWKKNGSSVSTSSTYTYIPANGDNVYCVLSSNYRCRIMDTAASNRLSMVVAAPVVPVVAITANPGLSIAPGATLELTATVTNSVPSPSYQWLVNGAAVPGAVGQTYLNNTYADLDVVTCEVRSGGVCPGILGTKSVTVDINTVGVKGIDASVSNIQLLPNPNKGVFMLKGSLGTATDEELSVEITNMLGQVIYTGRLVARNGEVNGQIQLSNTLANGMYLLNLRSATGNKVFHLIVEQ